MSTPAANADPAELAKFGSHAARWWDASGAARPLHDLNPVRAAWIAARMSLQGARIADVGCGGGLLSEALVARGAQVTGIDLSSELIEVARLHLYESNLSVDYRVSS
ncbi:ubiquinone biosynthesis O-methyltransferase, partial [mine drainage metagenome]